MVERFFVNSTFSETGYDYSIKTTEVCSIFNRTSLCVRTISQAISLRQSDEWRTLAFQTRLLRWKDTIIYDERVEREDMLLCAVHLFNLQTRLIGSNQLRTNSVPHSDCDID